MTKWTEETMSQAIFAVENGLSKTAAAKQYGIPKSTLLGRLSGAVNKKQCAVDRQVLSDIQESSLAEWAKIQEMLGAAPTHDQLRLVAQRVLQEGGNNHALGKHWVAHFLRRNPSVKTYQGKKIETKRMKGVTPDKIKEFFEVLGGPLLKHVRPHLRFNMDETGLMEGEGHNGRRIGATVDRSSKKKRWVLTKDRAERTWISIIECISAGGDYLPPVVIYTGKSVQQQWFPKDLTDYESWQFTASENGWTCNDIGHEWLTQHFLPKTDPGQGDWRILIIDGHNSHVSDEFMVSCAMNKVYLAPLPPHSSHVTQPLDISVFSPLKSYYRKSLDKFGNDDIGSAVSKQNFLCAYDKARKAAFTRRNILSGWRATGLWPVDINKPLNNPYVMEQPPTPSIEPPKLTPVKKKAPVMLATPHGGADLRKMLGSQQGNLTRSTRAALRKAARALDLKDVKLATVHMETKILKQQIEDLKPKKRAKVIPDPNRRFVKLDQVRVAQAKAIAREKSNTRSKASETYSLAGTCLKL